MEKIYNKLVRDLTPSILKGKNIKYKIISVDNGTVIPYVLNKFIEELDEVSQAIKEKNKEKICEELADLLTVIFKLGECYDIGNDELLEKEEQKTNSNGEFEENFILKWVDE